MICSVKECGKPALTRGWCCLHYERWKRHGDPEGGRALNGSAAAYLRDVVLVHVGSDCLDWPYATQAPGYGVMRHDGKRKLVSRVVCEAVNGPPPFRDSEAAHSCGRGDKGCVAPAHLRWASPRENSADKEQHGTIPRGEAHTMHKLSAAAVPLIRDARGVVSQRELASTFGVSQSLISHVQNRAAWRHVPEDA